MYKSFFSMPPPEDKPHESIKQEKDNTIAIDQESLPRKTDLNENSKNDVPPPIEQSIELKSFEFSEFDSIFFTFSINSIIFCPFRHDT